MWLASITHRGVVTLIILIAGLGNLHFVELRKMTFVMKEGCGLVLDCL
jgi:hypothetical protein